MVTNVADIDIKSHDRYRIYEMLGRKVSFRNPISNGRKAGRKLSGVVEQVCRNIFENAVELTMGGQVFQFAEPVAIVGDSDVVAFVYGDFDMADLTDEQLFEEMRDSAGYGENVDDILARTRPRVVKIIQFALGDKVIRRGKTWRKT